MRKPDLKIWSIRERVGIGSERRERRPKGEMRREGVERRGGKTPSEDTRREEGDRNGSSGPD